MSTYQHRASSAGYTLAYLVCYLIGIGTGILLGWMMWDMPGIVRY